MRPFTRACSASDSAFLLPGEFLQSNWPIGLARHPSKGELPPASTTGSAQRTAGKGSDAQSQRLLREVRPSLGNSCLFRYLERLPTKGPGRPTMIDHEAVARRYRSQAELFRARSEMMKDESARSQYQIIADAYDGLADNEEWLALKNKFASVGGLFRSGENRQTDPRPPASSRRR